MASDDAANGLSMAEILASIKRIISEDEQNVGNAEAASSDASAASAPSEADEAEVVELYASQADDANDANADEEAADAVEGEIAADDILELKVMVEDDGSIVDLDAAAPAGDIVFEMQADASPIDDAIIVSDAIDTEKADELIPVAEDDSNDPVEEETSMVAETETADETPGRKEILSADTAAVAGAAFAQLSETNKPAGQSVDDLMRELLRPMLQQWLDENLPPLVEKMVDREISRISGRDEVP